MNDLNELVNRLAAETLALRPMLLKAAAAESAHKNARAQAMLVAKAEGSTVAMAEAKADADCGDLFTARLTTAAIADSQKELVRSLRTGVEAERTFRADLRAADVAMTHGAAP